MLDIASTETTLTASEVARLFRVDVRTIKRWTDTGALSYFRTPGGHYRFRGTEVRALLGGDRS